MKKETVKTFISIEDVIKNGNSSVNQEIKSRFVGREVLCCMTGIVEYILKMTYETKDAPFSIDDIENMYAYQDIVYTHEGKTKYFSGTKEGKNDLIQSLRDEIEESAGLLEDHTITEFTHDTNVKGFEDAIEALESAESEPQEILEWWAVNDWLMNKLKEQGEPIIDTYPCLWGRTCSGQAILLDYAITRICADMEILEGQKNSWAKE